MSTRIENITPAELADWLAAAIENEVPQAFRVYNPAQAEALAAGRAGDTVRGRELMDQIDSDKALQELGDVDELTESHISRTPARVEDAGNGAMRLAIDTRRVDVLDDEGQRPHRLERCIDMTFVAAPGGAVDIFPQVWLRPVHPYVGRILERAAREAAKAEAPEPARPKWWPKPGSSKERRFASDFPRLDRAHSKTLSVQGASLETGIPRERAGQILRWGWATRQADEDRNSSP